MTPDQARSAASRSLGGFLSTKDQCREALGLRLIGELRQDVHYAARTLATNPGFAIVAVLSLAIGIGANTAIFSFADAVLLRPLPVARPGEVVTIGSTSSFDSLGSSLVSSYRDYVDIRDRSKSVDGIAALTRVTVGFAPDAKVQPRLKLGMLVTGNLLSLMGVTPTIGRDFRADEDQVPGRDAVIILGHTLWEQEFNADPGVLGRRVRISGLDFTVVGVTPRSFTGMDQFARYDFYCDDESPRLTRPGRVDRTRDARTSGSRRCEGRRVASSARRARRHRRRERRTRREQETASRRTTELVRASRSSADARCRDVSNARLACFVAAGTRGMSHSRAPAGLARWRCRLAVARTKPLIRQLVPKACSRNAAAPRLAWLRRQAPYQISSRPICRSTCRSDGSAGARFSLIVAFAPVIVSVCPPSRRTEEYSPP